MTLATTIVADGAVGFWKFNDAVGTTSLVDTIGNANCVPTGGTFTLGQGGIAGGGGDTAITSATNGVVADVTAMRVADTFTFEICVKRSGTQSANQGLVGGHAGGCAAIRFNTSNQIELWRSNVASTCTSTITITDTTSFHHIMATKTGSAAHIYIDGVDVTGTITTGAASTTSGHGYLVLADNQANGVGTFAYAAVYPSVLTPTQAANHYTLMSTGTAPVNTVAPVASGTMIVGRVLACTSGTWTDVYSNGTYAYQWQRDNQGGGTYTNISGAVLATYTVRQGDYGSHIRCAVTDTNSGGSATTNSNALGLVTLPQRVGVTV